MPPSHPSDRLAIDWLEVEVAFMSVWAPDMPRHLSELVKLLMRQFECEGRFEDLERAINYQVDVVNLTRRRANDKDKSKRLDVLEWLFIRRLECEEKFEDLDRAIEDQRGIVAVTPAGDSDKPRRLSVLGGLLMRRFERQRILDMAVKCQQVAMYFMPAGSDKQERLDVLNGLLKLPFERRRMFDDLEEAIKNQRAAVDLMSAGDEDKSERLDVLGQLLMYRFESKGMLADLDGAICIYRARAVLAPADDEREQRERLKNLEKLMERRLKIVGDRNCQMESWPSLSAALPRTLGRARGLYEIVKDQLVEDLQQLSICVKKSKHRELATNLRRMENAILCLELQDGDKLCQDVFKASTRLGAYCQALRNRAYDETDRAELEDLYKEFVRIEREFSAAHDRINSKYEQLYKQWKAERQSISKFLSKADLTKSQGNNLEIRALVEQVDAGFEKIGNALKKEANDLKSLSETLNDLSKLVHVSPDPPITSNDPAQISPQPPDPPPTASEVSPQVDDVIETLSQVDALVEKSRYTKARQIVSETSSKTKQKLKKLRISSEDYDEESRTLSCLRTHRHNDHSRGVWNRQRELCNQLSNLVGGMHRMLKGIEKGFSGCKASIQGLVFRPLGDLLCDLEPYMSQAGFEVSSKGLHPDLILYEAAFQAIADSIPAQSELLEHIKGSLSVLDKLRGV